MPLFQPERSRARRQFRAAALAVVWACVIGGTVAAAAAPPLDDATIARLTDRVRQALLWQRGPERPMLLAGLRVLRDPSLRPLFVQCAASDDPFLRTQGILGLAELSPSSSIDLLLVKRIPSSREQAAIVMQAMRLGLLGDEAAADAALWPGIEPRLRVRLYERARRSGQLLQVAGLRELLSDPDLVAAAMAQIELEERGEPLIPSQPGGSVAPHPGAMVPPLQRLLARTDPARSDDLRAVLASVRHSSAGSAAKWVRSLRTHGAESELIRHEALAALLVIAPERASTAAEWLADWTAFPDAASRSRLMLTALDATLDARLAGRSAEFAPAVFGVVDDGPVFRALAAAGRAVGDADAPAESLRTALRDVADLRHAPAARWVVRAAALPALGDAERAAVLAASVEAARSEHSQRDPALIDAAATAVASWPVSRLTDLEPILARSIRESDGAVAIAVLSGLARLGAAESSRLVSEVASSAAAEGLDWPGGPEGSAAGLAMLLMISPKLAAGSTAAFDEGTATPPASSLVDLALAPGVPEVLQVQAAWLALRSAGREQAALARVLTHVDPLE